ncbi:hypothetical protein BIY24_09780 [Halobacteriovorax marinus]|uniref:GNAT family N-acetyltransferase n=1 Tax=Halobacteriovorax marinus TaxID=97084 RepID=UPI000BC2FEEC|nr:GNAT family N-acetyltransferase [Halobacteriovorax marinus]ATH08228.1 hypothetical protein BIY24_09780 [Halobacteriovorax marinus]
MEIVSYASLSNDIQKEYLNQIKEIFFACSSIKTFKDSDHRESFFQKWCGDYLEYSSREFFLCLIDKRVAGYLSGHLNSKEALSKFIIPGPETFEDCFERFPAHFHINCSPNHQGKGIGRKLVEHYLSELNNYGVDGVHLITSTDANNLGFYRALGFEHEVSRPFKKHELLLMGREIIA